MRKQLCFLSMFLCVFVLYKPITGFAQTNYYSNSSGNLDQLSTWGTNTNGTGTAPANFTAANLIFNIQNNATPTIGSTWTVSGAGSKIVVGDGTNPCNFQIPSNYRYNGTADVSANATLSIANTTIPTLGILAATSTVVYNSNSNQTIPLATYGNLVYAGSAFGTMVSGGCNITGSLSVTNGTLQMDNYSTSYTYNVSGNLNVTTSGLLDLGSNNNNNGKSAVINLSGNLIQTGSGQIYCTGIQTPNGVINFSGTAQNIQQASSDFVNYNVMSGSTCTLTANFSFNGDNTQTAFKGYFTVNSGGTLNCGTNLVIGYSTDNKPNPDNTFILSSGASILTANTAGIASSGTTGSIQTMVATFSSGSNYTYNGVAAQITGIFSTTGATLNSLTINNAAGVTLSQAQNVKGALYLTKGLLNTTMTNLLTLNNAAVVLGGSQTSYVNGPIKKIGSQAFTFPVGSAGTGYVPIGISAPTTTTDAFLAQYNRSSAVALGPICAAGLDHVSACDYWTLNHTAGSSAVNVTGYWSSVNKCSPTYPYVTNLPTMALAHFNTASSCWDNWGYNGSTGNTTSGSVTWNNVSNFSPFSLGSTNVMNPLPVTLTDFNAQWNPAGTVGLSWKTEEELNSSLFNIQRSADGANWQTVGTLPAKGSSNTEIDYSFTDASPFPQLDYYRLQVVDIDGNNSYSAIKILNAQLKNIRIYPNPAQDQINITMASGSLAGTMTIRLINVEGKVLLQKEISNIGGQTITLPVSTYPQGVYLVQVITPGNVQQSGTVIIRRN